MNELMKMYITRRNDDGGNEYRPDPENRRGRDGRFVPGNNWREDYEDRRYSMEPYPHRIGFAMEHEPMRMPVDRRMEYDEPHNGGYSSGRNHHMDRGVTNFVPKFNREMAEEWVAGMVDDEGRKVDRVTFDRAKQLMEQRGVKADPYEFWAVLNAIKSDYGMVLSRHGLINNNEFLADMANAWINDPDAVSNKASAYYLYVVEK